MQAVRADNREGERGRRRDIANSNPVRNMVSDLIIATCHERQSTSNVSTCYRRLTPPDCPIKYLVYYYSVVIIIFSYNSLYIIYRTDYAKINILTFTEIANVIHLNDINYLTNICFMCKRSF